MGQTVWKYTPPFDDVIGGPGNRKLLKGTMKAGWFGEVKASELITGDELARLIGLTAGTSQYSNEPWLKFAYKGDILFIAKKPFRHSISWEEIEKVNAIYGDRLINHKGLKFALMLPRAIGEDVQPNPKVVSNVYNEAANYNSMWNKLMLPIHKNAPSNWRYKKNVNSPTENWNVGYTDADLIVESRAGKGSNSWCQEKVGNLYAILRGSGDISDSTKFYFSSRYPFCGWRPVLKLIE